MLIQSGNSKLLRALLIAMIFIGVCASSRLQAQARSVNSFSVRDHYRSGEKLIFDYYAPYPGMTKVKLFDKGGNLLWRGQYVDPQGDNQLRLRASLLEPGIAYAFEFEYKAKRVKVPVTVD